MVPNADFREASEFHGGEWVDSLHLSCHHINLEYKLISGIRMKTFL